MITVGSRSESICPSYGERGVLRSGNGGTDRAKDPGMSRFQEVRPCRAAKARCPEIPRSNLRCKKYSPTLWVLNILFHIWFLIRNVPSVYHFSRSCVNVKILYNSFFLELETWVSQRHVISVLREKTYPNPRGIRPISIYHGMWRHSFLFSNSKKEISHDRFGSKNFNRQT